METSLTAADTLGPPPSGQSPCALASGAAPASCRPTRGLPWPALPRCALLIRAPSATPFSHACHIPECGAQLDRTPSSTHSSS
eukprot:1750161-Rhodomonas_salina.1